ncbi:hypothetical protein CRE_19614 [Caenorhabditis remanei]|uniref:T-box domain-containing protein n=1 Tax=Caenorhabditis remanei TaxID=31234 RepID=E3NUF0_CAERE|nr:hypothetical protein CRE_19614 [Caenorhabditis remanei]
MYPNYYQNSHNYPVAAQNQQTDANGQHGNQDYLQYAANQYWTQTGYMNNYNPPAPPVQTPFEQINPDVIKVTLHDSKLWKAFHVLDNEMVTLPNGRQIFPTLHYDVAGLPHSANYIFGLKLQRVNKNYLMEYRGGEWKETGKSVKADLESNEIFAGVMGGGVNFKNARIQSLRRYNTKGKDKEESQKPKGDQNKDISLFVTSHCRYTPILSVYYMQSSEKKFLKSFVFKETQFVAVTGYKNDAVRKLKTNKNPFARPDYKEDYKEDVVENSEKDSTWDSGISSMNSTVASSIESPTSRRDSGVSSHSQNQYQFWGSSMTPGPFIKKEPTPENSRFDMNYTSGGASTSDSQNQYQFWNSSMTQGKSSGVKMEPISFNMDLNSQYNNLPPLHSWQQDPYPLTATPGPSNQPWDENSFGQKQNYKF